MKTLGFALLGICLWASPNHAAIRSRCDGLLAVQQREAGVPAVSIEKLGGDLRVAVSTLLADGVASGRREYVPRRGFSWFTHYRANVVYADGDSEVVILDLRSFANLTALTDVRSIYLRDHDR